MSRPGDAAEMREVSEARSKQTALKVVDLGRFLLTRLFDLSTPNFEGSQDNAMDGLFPLPLPQSNWTIGGRKFEEWGEGIIRSLNWLSVGSFAVGKEVPTQRQKVLINQIGQNLKVLNYWSTCEVGAFDVNSFWNQKHVNSYGEEVHVAQSVRWANVDESLPKPGVAGIVPALEVCEGGMRDFIQNPEAWVKPISQQVWMKPPKVMIPEDDWPLMVEGLLSREICGIMPLDEAFRVDGSPILGGLFGVPKNEEKPDGTPIVRLIMDLRPINQNFLPLGGDLSTLPVMSQMFQLELQPHQDLIISSEDIRAMFYVIGLPPVWNKFLCFSRTIPRRFAPDSSKDYVLFSRVLPMGFINSVALAQHLHRRIVSRALRGYLPLSHEIRRDRDFPRVHDFYRIYLDNFDSLSARSKNILEAGKPSLTELLQEEYQNMKVPRNEKKSVSDSNVAEVQGAWIDGVQGICCAKASKVTKYLLAVVEVVKQGRASQKQLQMLAGGLVYLFSFRRCLMSCLNEIWTFIIRCSNDKGLVPLPRKVEEELVASFYLTALSFIDFRAGVDPVVTASDASETGGGLTRSVGLTCFGVQASKALVRGELPDEEADQGLLAISAFDGIGSLRVALDILQIPVSGYVAIEKDPKARRVVESAFPSSLFVEDITKIDKTHVQQWAASFPNCKCVLVAGGPPCQGIPSSNQSKSGAERESRSSLYKAFCKLRQWVREVFTWCPTYGLMESVFSISCEDRALYSTGMGVLPYLVDSKGCSLCRRPRLWWFDWVVKSQEGVTIFPPPSSHSKDFGVIEITCQVDPKWFLNPGWRLTSPDYRFCTFTTSQPKQRPGGQPTGLFSASAKDLEKWASDRYRFPVYTYQYQNGVTHKKKGWRLLSISEKELIMGYPAGYTLHANTKQFRKNHPLEADDIRMSLIGNSWNVGVAACLLSDLAVQEGFISPLAISDLLRRLRPGESSSLSGFLFRPPLGGNPKPFAVNQSDKVEEREVVSRLAHLVSSKGSDVLLTSQTESTPKSYRFRTSLPAKLWQWKTVCGWRWRHQQRGPEHINKLELRAAYTGLKWRILKHQTCNRKVLHLLDSMVSLQVLNKGRSSSHKLRRLTKRFACLLLASGISLVLAYTDTHQSPADRPSRRPRKRKW